MLRNSSDFGHDVSSYAESIISTGYSTLDDGSTQISSVSRPSAKSVYMQRKEYAISMNKMMGKLQYRVEHLFTCEVDGKDLQSVGDCVERLKLLDGMGRVWAQEMLLEMRGANLLLTDIETKEELDALALSSVVELQAVMDSGVYNSLLTVTVHDSSRRTTNVLMFQCEDLRADYIKNDLSRGLALKSEDASIGHVETMSERGLVRHLQSTDLSTPPSSHHSGDWKVPDDPGWNAPDYEEDEDDNVPTPTLATPRKATPPPRRKTSLPPPVFEEEALPLQRPYTEVDRKVDIFNHIIGDLEIFTGHLAAILAKDQLKKKKWKVKKKKELQGMPLAEDFTICLHKIKCGFNLIGELNGKITNPSAPDYVHVLFTTLEFVLLHCPKEVPSSIVAPLLTPECIRLLSEEATSEEDTLWQTLGDPWNIPSTKWPEDDDDIPTYTLEFSDGWQAPEVTAVPQHTEPASRQQRLRPAHSQRPPQKTPLPQPLQPPQKPQPSQHPKPPKHPQLLEHSQPPEHPQLPPPHPEEPNLGYMRVMYDFTARNQRELDITNGDVVQLLDMSKKWWKVRNAGGEVGYVPNNVLESLEQEEEQMSVLPVLTNKSKPAEVTAWLRDKDFSKITVRCLGTLSGVTLLGMSREELKSVCPEEGGRVFLQLQAVKTAMNISNQG